MSEMLRGGYEMIWREDRLDDALVALDGAGAVTDFFRDFIDRFDELDVRWELYDVGDGRTFAITSANGRGRVRARAAFEARLRVVAGRFGGRRLERPRGAPTRPTADRVREALFSMLGDVDGDRVLDLFAGSGALGIEALSRGAASAVFVERDARAAAAIKRNLESLGVEARVARQDVLGFLGREQGPFDLVFCDPPYDSASRLSGHARRAPAGAHPSDSPHRDRIRQAQPARIAVPAHRRAGLRRHSHRHPWPLSATAGPRSARGPTTRSRWATSTSSGGPPTCSTTWSWGW